MQRRRHTFHTRLRSLKEAAFVKPDFRDTLNLINAWFTRTKFDGIVYEEPRAAAAPQPDTPEALGTPVEQTEALSQPAPPLTEIIAPAQSPPCATVIASPPDGDVERLAQKTLVLQQLYSRPGQISEQAPSPTEALLQAVLSRLRRLDDSLQVIVTAQSVSIGNENTGYRTVALAGQSLEDVAEPWTDDWDRKCIAVLVDSGRSQQLSVIDVFRSLLLGVWTIDVPAPVRWARVRWAGEGVVAVLINSGSTQLHAVRLPDDEKSTKMLPWISVPVPLGAHRVHDWRACCREDLAFGCALQGETNTLIGDIYDGGRSLWCEHTCVLDRLAAPDRVGQCSAEAAGSILSYLVSANQRQTYLEFLAEWFRAAAQPISLLFLRYDLLRAWLQELKPQPRLQRVSLTRWRTELLERWALSLPRILCEYCLPRLIDSIDKLPSLLELMHAVAANDKARFRKACEPFENSSSLEVSPFLDVVLEACLQAQL